MKSLGIPAKSFAKLPIRRVALAAAGTGTRLLLTRPSVRIFHKHQSAYCHPGYDVLDIGNHASSSAPARLKPPMSSNISTATVVSSMLSTASTRERTASKNHYCHGDFPPLIRRSCLSGLSLPGQGESFLVKIPLFVIIMGFCLRLLPKRNLISFLFLVIVRTTFS